VFPATDATTATPTVSPTGGTYTAIQTVTLSTTTVGAKIYYTTATGTSTPANPTSSSTLYSAPITINASTSLKAIAIKDNYNSSGILSTSYTINAFSAPPTLTLTAGDKKLTYSWTASTPAATSYDVYWKAGSNLSAAEVKTGTRIANATNNSSISGLTSGTAYSVVVTAYRSNYPSVDSNVETKTTPISAAEPVISVHPQSGFHNTNATLTVTANSTDGGALSYQWYKNISNSNSGGTAISGATNSSYTLTLSGNYYVVVTNTIANNGDGGTKTAQTPSNVAAVNVETDTAIWAKSVSAGSDWSHFKATTVDSSGNIYAVGSVGSGSFTFGSGVSVAGSGTVLVKYDSNGTALWAKTLSGNSGATFNAVALDSSGNIYVAGSQSGSSSYTYGSGVSVAGNGTNNAVLVKYDSSGTALWARSVIANGNQSHNSRFDAVAVDPWGDVYTAGYQSYDSYTYGTITIQGGADGNRGNNSVLVKYDSSGTVQWAQTVSYSAGDYLPGSNFYALATDSSGNVYAAGSQVGTGIYTYGTNVSAQAVNSYDSGGAIDNVVLVKYYNNGTALWARTASGYNPQYSSCFNALAIDSTGSVYAAGRQSGNVSFGSGVSLSDSVSGAILVKYNTNGDAQWAQRSSTGGGEFKAVAVDSSNNVYAAGNIGTATVTFGANKTAQGNSSVSVLLVKFNSSGTALWARSVFSANNKDSAFLGVAANSSGVYAVGYQSGTGNFSYSTLDPATVVSGSSSSTNAVLVKFNR